jgi:hypothetical protein
MLKVRAVHSAPIHDASRLILMIVLLQCFVSLS